MSMEIISIETRPRTRARLPRTKTGLCLTCYGLTRSKLDPAFTWSVWSERSAYLLGFFFADGYLLDTDGRKRLGFALADRQLFDAVYKALGLSHAVRQQVSGAWRVQFGSARLFDELVAFGCTPRKSLTVTMPEIPAEWPGPFIRGFFDGDGSFSVRLEPRVRTSAYPHPVLSFSSGSEDFLSDLAALIERAVGICGRLRTGHGCYTLLYTSKAAVRALYQLMYDDGSPDLCCAAKRQKIEDYLDLVASRPLYTFRRSGQVISA